jgi:hypothetical protein
VELLLGKKEGYDEWDLCRPLLPVEYSPSGHHSSGWKSGFMKWAVLKWELHASASWRKGMIVGYLLAKYGGLERLNLHTMSKAWFQLIH